MKIVLLYNDLHLSSELQTCSALPLGFFHLDSSRAIGQSQTCGFPWILALFLSTSPLAPLSMNGTASNPGAPCKMPSLQSLHVHYLINTYWVGQKVHSDFFVTPYCFLLSSFLPPSSQSKLSSTLSELLQEPPIKDIYMVFYTTARIFLSKCKFWW